MTVASNLDYLSERTEIDCVCGASGGSTFRRVDRYGLKFQYKLCTNCGHVRTSNPVSDEAARRFYSSSDYRSMYHPRKSPEDLFRQKTPMPFASSPLLKYVQDQGFKRGKLCEWGCGGGWNLVPFRDAGWNVSGYDYDVLYTQLGRSILGLSLHVIPPDVAELQSEQPDVILLNHVLEHSVDPVSLLLRLRQLCNDSTALVVGVPLLETIRIWHWHDFFHIAHIHYFSAESLVRVANHAGFVVTHADVQSGLFTLMLGRDVVPQPTNRAFVFRSARLLLSGFMEPRHRIPQAFRGVLASVGLIGIARRIKRRLRK